MLRNLFSDKRFWKAVTALSLPIAIQNLLTSSFSLVDTLMVGRLGDIPLAAVGIAGQWSWLLNMLTFGVCSSAAVFFAQFFGEKNRRGIVHTYSVALTAGLFFSLLFLLAGLFIPETILRVFNRTPEVVSHGTAYLKIAVFSYPAIMLNMLLNMLLRSTGRVRLPMFVSLITTALNIFLDYSLIFGAFGLPALGIQGAAIATVFSAWSGPLLLLLFMAIVRDDTVFAPMGELFGFEFSFVKRFFRRATPVILNETFWGLGTTAYNAIFSNMGYEYAAAVSILRTFENIAFAFMAGLTHSASVFIGQDIGKGEIRKGIENAKRFMIFVPFVALCLGVVVLLSRQQLVDIFNMGQTISEKTLSAARGILLVYALETAIRNIPYVSIVGVFRSGGDTKKGMQYEMFSLWAISVPMTFIASVFLKLPFVAVFAISYICEDYLKAILCLRHFASGRWIQPVTESGKAGLAEYLEQKNNALLG